MALRLAGAGAHVACIDKDGATAAATAEAITKLHGFGIGVAGSGISHCGPAIGLEADITDRASVRAMLDQRILAYGGLDAVAVTAGIFIPADIQGHIRDEQWSLTFAINVMGLALIADESTQLWRAQDLPASMVLTTSVNAAAKQSSRDHRFLSVELSS